MRRDWLGLGALLAVSFAALSACDDGTPIRRGFGSTQLVQLRDPTFEFWSSKGDLVFYRTGRDEFGNGDPIFWSVNLNTGETTNLGPTMPDLTTPQPPTRYACEYGAGVDGRQTTYKVTDTQTGELTTIENVYGTVPYCPVDDDPTLQVWRIEADDTLTLWTGPYTYLVQAPLPFAVHSLFGRTSKGWLVSAPSPTPPDGLGVYALTDQDLTTATEVLPAALDTAAWATGAVPSASPLASSGLAENSLFLPAGSHRYCYERAMADGSTIMFAGPQPTGPGELALFPVDPISNLRVLNVAPYDYRYTGVYAFIDAWSSLEGNPTTSMFRIWRPDSGLFAGCAWPGDQFPNSFLDPAGENAVLLQQQNSYQLRDPSPFMLVVPGAPVGSQCKLMAPTAVGYADFSPDGTALAWLVEPSDDKPTLWTAARDGSAPRAIGTDYIDGFNYGLTRAPHFVGDAQLEFTLAGDLVWVDVHDDPVQVHYITEQVFGASVDLGRWLVSGHDYSDQDSNGALALINRDSGETREISPAVAMYASPDVPVYGVTPGVYKDDGSPVRIIYLVRGRNPSAQDGLWVATITAEDRK